MHSHVSNNADDGLNGMDFGQAESDSYFMTGWESGLLLDLECESHQGPTKIQTSKNCSHRHGTTLISRGQPVGPAPMPPGDRGYHRLWDSRDLAETFPVGIGFLGLQLHLWHGPFGGQHQGKTHPKSIQKLFFSGIVSVR